jgi:hypothetical protein
VVTAKQGKNLFRAVVGLDALLSPSVIQLKLRSHIISTNRELPLSGSARLTNGVKALIIKPGFAMNSLDE